MDKYFKISHIKRFTNLHCKPLEARLAALAEDFSWSSDRFYRRGRAPAWFDLDRAIS